MLTIRLQRTGRKNRAFFRIVLAEKQRAVKKQALEILGHYDPHSKDFAIKDEERLKYWLDKNVELSETAHNLLVNKGLLKADKVKAWRPKKKEVVQGAESESAGTKEPAKEDRPAEPGVKEVASKDVAAVKPRTEQTIPEEQPKEDVAAETAEEAK